MQQVKGKIHSFETFGTVDGPGIRHVIFFAGCPLRCSYCQNMDVVLDKNAKEYTVEEVVKMVLKEKEYLTASGGGVTVSGGDPVFQIPFIVKLFKKLRKAGIRTAVDTSLMTIKSNVDKLLPVTDLFMVSIKQLDEKLHHQLTGSTNKLILDNIRYLSSKTKKIWFRYLVLPGYTDGPLDIQRLIAFLKPLQFELLELLPYHTLGVDKWQKLGVPYALPKVKPPTPEEVVRIRHLIEKAGIVVKCEY